MEGSGRRQWGIWRLWRRRTPNTQGVFTGKWNSIDLRTVDNSVSEYMEAFLGKFWKEIRQFEWTWHWLIRTAFQDRNANGRETSGSGNKIEQDVYNREKGKRKSGEEKREGLPWWLRGKESACQCKRRGFGSWPKKISHTAEPRHHSYWTVLESPGAAITRPMCPRVRTSKQEKPRQWETWAPQPLRILCSPQLEKSPCSHKGSAQPKLNINENLKKEVGGGKHQENSGSQLSDFCILPKNKQKQQKQELWEMRKAVLNLASY